MKIRVISILRWVFFFIGFVYLLGYWSPLGFIYFIIFHEMGHAIIAAYKGKFVGFDFQGGNPGTLVRGSDLHTLSAGFIFNLITIPIVLKLFNNNILFYLSIVAVGSHSDFNQFRKFLHSRKNVIDEK